MSHYTSIKTRIQDRGALVKALADVGFTSVEIHEAPQHLVGYMGDKRLQTADIIIRKRYVGAASNDIGFHRCEDGSYEAIISDYDRTKYSPVWLQRLTQRYAYHVTCSKLELQGFYLATDEVQRDGQIHLMLRRMG
jgi:hypothetical protein